MIVVGLTGSIGMGKSTAAGMLRRMRIPVHDADRAVHRLMEPGGAAVRRVAEAFPQALKGDHIDRRILGDLVFGNTPALRRLEAILHPLVRRSARAFLTAASLRRCSIVILDIPLLYESGGAATVDAVIVVSAPALVQRQRVLARPGMTEAKFRAILSRQIPDPVKRRRADVVIRTGGPLGATFRQLRGAMRRLRSGGYGGQAWPPRRIRR